MKKIALMLAVCLLVSLLPVPMLAEQNEADVVMTAPIEEAVEESREVVIFGEDDAPDAEDDLPVDTDDEPGDEAPVPVEVAVEPEEGSEAPADQAETAETPEPAPVEAVVGPEEDFEAPADQAETAETPEPAPVEAVVEPEAESEAPAMQGEPAASPEPTPQPGAPVLSVDALTLGAGEKYQLEAELPEGAASLSYESADPAVAKVSGAGLITAVAPGDTVISVRADGGPAAQCAVHVAQAPDSVRFSEDSVVLGAGEEAPLPEIILGSGDCACAGAYTVTSNDESVARVGEDGTLVAVAKGETTITVRTYNGREGSCTVTVMDAPASLEASIDLDTLGVGEVTRAHYVLPEGAVGQVRFESTDPAVAEVDAATGAVTGVAPGEARIRAVAYNGTSAEAAVIVRKAPTRLTLKPAQLTLGVGMKKALKAAINSGAAGTIKIKSGNRKVARITSDGAVKAVGVGETVITASTYNGLTAECAVVVMARPEGVTLPFAKRTIGVNETLVLEPDIGDAYTEFTYTSSNRKYVRVYKDGRVKGVAVGKAYVTVATHNGKSVRVRITVKKEPDAITLSRTSRDMAIGSGFRLRAKLPSGTGGTVTFSSTDEAVATVDARTGRVTAVGAGTADICATLYNGLQETCRVTVHPKPEWIQTDVTSLKMGVGQRVKIKTQLSPDSLSPITFASRDEAVATVSASGYVTAVAPGTTKIDVTTNADGVRAVVRVRVLPATQSVRFRKKQLELENGKTLQLKPIVDRGIAAGFTYRSSKKKVATVSKTGEVFGAGPGTTKITVKTHNGLKASIKIKVFDPTYPEAVTITNIPQEIGVGDTYQLEIACEPETAVPEMMWSTDDEEIATISQDGVITGVGSGYVHIIAQSLRNPDIQLQFQMSVAMEGVTLVIPARQTDIAGIPHNLEMIDDIRKVAIAQINALQTAGRISDYDAWKRRDIVNNIFQDYAFPWMTPEYQPYWKWENSEGGVKDFKPGIVYYGMPYISGSGNNRRYNRAKALSEARYTDSGNGYYMLNRGNLLNGKYVGNDCSGLVDQAIWGTGSSHSGDRTADIAVISAYRTISDYTAMRPGDLLCKGNAHVIMFLYYTNPEHTKMMFIENGGSEPGTNTVHCLVGRVYYYKWAGYKVRRLSNLG